MARRTNNVKSIDGLQDLLGSGVSVLKQIRQKDLPWAKTMISAVNSGNSLLRTQNLLSRKASED